MPDTTPWQTETQYRLNEAGRVAVAGNRSVVVQVSPGAYEFYSLTVPAHVALVFGTGHASREADLIYIGGDGGEPLIRLKGGYSTGITGCQIRAKYTATAKLTGIYVDGVVNGFIRNVRVDLRGVDCVGLNIVGRESLAVDRAELRASNPVVYAWGDNVSMRNVDLGCSGAVSLMPDCAIRLVGMPHQVDIHGSVQGGKHLVFGNIASGTSGQCLNLSVRWEQSTSTEDANTAAIKISCLDRLLENLLLVGTRWTQRKRAYDLIGVLKTTEVGCWLPGT